MAIASPVIRPVEPDQTGCLDRNLVKGDLIPKRYSVFSGYYVDRKLRGVFQNGSRLNLNGKAYEALTVLLSRAGEVVPRKELYSQLWGVETETAVDMNANLNTVMNKLRGALQDPARNSSVITTIKGRGYSVVALVDHSDSPPMVGIDERSSAAVVSKSHRSKWFFGQGNARWLWLYSAALFLFGIFVGTAFELYWMSRSAMWK